MGLGQDILKPDSLGDHGGAGHDLGSEQADQGDRDTAGGPETLSAPVALRVLACAGTQRLGLSPASSCAVSSSPAPFCGPKISAAPRGPVSGLSTSTAIRQLTSVAYGCSRSRFRSAICSQALPPRGVIVVGELRPRCTQNPTAAGGD